MKLTKKDRRLRRATRARAKIREKAEARLTVHRTPRHMYAQVTTPDGAKLYVALSDTDQVAVIDIRKRELATTIDGVGDEPWGTMMTGTSLNYCH